MKLPGAGSIHLPALHGRDLQSKNFVLQTTQRIYYIACRFHPVAFCEAVGHSHIATHHHKTTPSKQHIMLNHQNSTNLRGQWTWESDFTEHSRKFSTKLVQASELISQYTASDDTKIAQGIVLSRNINLATVFLKVIKYMIKRIPKGAPRKDIFCSHRPSEKPKNWSLRVWFATTPWFLFRPKIRQLIEEPRSHCEFSA